LSTRARYIGNLPSLPRDHISSPAGAQSTGENLNTGISVFLIMKNKDFSE
jgi:hypothetical protein